LKMQSWLSQRIATESVAPSPQPSPVVGQCMRRSY